jgi:hypothetical protein
LKLRPACFPPDISAQPDSTADARLAAKPRKFRTIPITAVILALAAEAVFSGDTADLVRDGTDITGIAPISDGRAFDAVPIQQEEPEAYNERYVEQTENEIYTRIPQPIDRAETGCIEAGCSYKALGQDVDRLTAFIDRQGAQDDTEIHRDGDDVTDAHQSSGDLARSDELGNLNEAGIGRVGQPNFATIHQSGDYNYAQITQVGVGHSASISQTGGAGNRAVIHQSN